MATPPRAPAAGPITGEETVRIIQNGKPVLAKSIDLMSSGPPGPKGDKGDQGAVGPKGDAGSSGAKGETGSAGATGAQGPKGDTGAAGPQGPKGDVGPAGAKGDIGPAGKDAPQIQRTILTTDSNGVATWTFPSAYSAGVKPVGSADVEDTSADTVTVKITNITNTTMTVKATKPVILLTLLNTQAAASVRVHLTAMAPA
jgi:hypothetical protein